MHREPLIDFRVDLLGSTLTFSSDLVLEWFRFAALSQIIVRNWDLVELACSWAFLGARVRNVVGKKPPSPFNSATIAVTMQSMILFPG